MAHAGKELAAHLDGFSGLEQLVVIRHAVQHQAHKDGDDNHQQHQAHEGKGSLLLDKHVPFDEGYEIPVDFVVERHKINQVVLSVVRIKRECFTAAHVFGNGFRVKFGGSAGLQVIEKVAGIVLINVSGAPDDIMPLEINHGAVAVGRSVHDEAVDDHVILNEMNVGDAEQGFHSDPADLVVIHANAVQDGFP